ncbi:hypothetical protein DM01DRAFT_1384247 [Hesseltinella vesiculosa]|uniref:Zinc-finger domain-containing protein n=1 Tax=Hesseltinella vesiculosa TaxID=101127 RepID=A0A1X2GEP3_9FUNG|nr:hypothetical protein DM01DRAFT_1384247 [Hesseltinella vesiculosa]
MSKQATLFQTMFKFRLDRSSTPSISSTPPADNLHKKVNDLNLTDKHPKLCQGQCKSGEQALACTARRPDGTACDLSWCYICVMKYTNKKMISMESGPSLVSKEWQPGTTQRVACPVCCQLCKCDFCKKSYRLVPYSRTPAESTTSPPEQVLVKSAKSKSKTASLQHPPLPQPPFQHPPHPQPPFPPQAGFRPHPFHASPPVIAPVAQRLSLVLSEEEIWIRLQIREFVFRFADVLGLDDRWLLSMQNVQGDWRLRHLTLRLVYRVLCIFYSNASPLQKTTRQILQEWAADVNMSHHLPFSKERLVMLGELIDRRGMSQARWADVQTLLTAADRASGSDYDDDEASDDDDSESDSDANSEDTAMTDPHSESESDYEPDGAPNHESDEEEERDLLAESPATLTDLEKLKLLQMTLDLTLSTDAIRQEIANASRPVKELEIELHQYTRQFDKDDLRDKAQRSRWLEQLEKQRKKGKKGQAMAEETQHDLDRIDDTIRTRARDMARKKQKVMVAQSRADPRLECLTTPWNGNDYYIFHDLSMTSSPSSKQATASSEDNEECWGRGVMIHGLDHSNKTPGRKRWWFLHGVSELKQLDKWLDSQYAMYAFEDESTFASFKQHLSRRVQYIKLLDHL